MQSEPKKGINWILMGIILIAVLVITGYDPVGEMVGKENGKYVIDAVLIGAIVYSFIWDKKKKG